MEVALGRSGNAASTSVSDHNTSVVPPQPFAAPIDPSKVIQLVLRLAEVTQQRDHLEQKCASQESALTTAAQETASLKGLMQRDRDHYEEQAKLIIDKAESYKAKAKASRRALQELMDTASKDFEAHQEAVSQLSAENSELRLAVQSSSKRFIAQLEEAERTIISLQQQVDTSREEAAEARAVAAQRKDVLFRERHQMQLELAHHEALRLVAEEKLSKSIEAVHQQQQQQQQAPAVIISDVAAPPPENVKAHGNAKSKRRHAAHRRSSRHDKRKKDKRHARGREKEERDGQRSSSSSASTSTTTQSSSFDDDSDHTSSTLSTSSSSESSSSSDRHRKHRSRKHAGSKATKNKREGSSRRMSSRADRKSGDEHLVESEDEHGAHPPAQLETPQRARDATTASQWRHHPRQRTTQVTATTTVDALHAPAGIQGGAQQHQQPQRHTPTATIIPARVQTLMNTAARQGGVQTSRHHGGAVDPYAYVEQRQRRDEQLSELDAQSDALRRTRNDRVIQSVDLMLSRVDFLR